MVECTKDKLASLSQCLSVLVKGDNIMLCCQTIIYNYIISETCGSIQIIGVLDYG